VYYFVLIANSLSTFTNRYIVEASGGSPQAFVKLLSLAVILHFQRVGSFLCILGDGEFLRQVLGGGGGGGRMVERCFDWIRGDSEFLFNAGRYGEIGEEEEEDDDSNDENNENDNDKKRKRSKKPKLRELREWVRLNVTETKYFKAMVHVFVHAVKCVASEPRRVEARGGAEGGNEER